MEFIRNIEDDKVEIFFTKPEYMAMENAKREFLKRSCLFSGSRSCWRSRGKINSSGHIINWLKQNGFEDKGTQWEKLSFGEKVEREQEKAADRVERMADRQSKAEKESDRRYQTAHEISSHIPMGQPIMVGHHSEKRHRRDIEKIDTNMRKSIEASDKAGYYGDRLKNAEYTAEGKKYKNAGYLMNRVKECNARIKECERGLQGKSYVYSQPTEISEERRSYWNGQLEEAKDKLGYMLFCLEQIREDKGVWDKESLAGKTKVKIGGRWREIVRCNPTTVSVTNNCFPTPELQRKYPLKYNYGQIQEAE